MKYIIEEYKPLTIPRSIGFEKIETFDPNIHDPWMKVEINNNNLFLLKINNVVVKVIPEYLDGPKPEKIRPIYLTGDRCKNVEEEFRAQNKPYPYIIKNFKYDGFMGRLAKNFAVYRAAFVNWSNDPGTANMLCSDGQYRLIPTFALKGGGISLPYNDTKNKSMFGVKSKS